MERCVEETAEYCRDRQVFGKPLIEKQVIQHKLGELKTEIECLRALTYRAAELHVSGQDVTRLASMVKLKAGRLIRDVTDSCLQYWGGQVGTSWRRRLLLASGKKGL